MRTSMLGELMDSTHGHENTGEPRATETGMRGSAGGRGKRAATAVPRLQPTRLHWGRWPNCMRVAGTLK